MNTFSMHRTAASIILRGPNDFYCDEMERSIHDSLCVVKRVLESKKVVAGGGCVEAALSIYLENFATSLVCVRSQPDHLMNHFLDYLLMRILHFSQFTELPRAIGYRRICPLVVGHSKNASRECGQRRHRFGS